MKKEFKVITDLLPNNVRVLDVGCGDGSLMSHLIKEKNIEVRGLEIKKKILKNVFIKACQLLKEMRKQSFINFQINPLILLY
tara:strand:+ start:511 stop:756 length:246 start_codon:yes stop_codon:yes gene_type:complete